MVTSLSQLLGVRTGHADTLGQSKNTSAIKDQQLRIVFVMRLQLTNLLSNNHRKKHHPAKQLSLDMSSDNCVTRRCLLYQADQRTLHSRTYNNCNGPRSTISDWQRERGAGGQADKRGEGGQSGQGGGGTRGRGGARERGPMKQNTNS